MDFQKVNPPVQDFKRLLVMCVFGESYKKTSGINPFLCIQITL